MAATRRLPQISLLLGAATVSIAVVSRASVRDRVASSLGVNVPGGIWRLIAIALAIVNLKNLPFVWHYRLFRALIYHLFLQPTQIKPQDLFKPVVQSSHTPLAECDYNTHKSNSTYFTDLDIARTHLVTAVLRNGIRGLGTRPDEAGSSFSFRNTSRAAGHKERKPEHGWPRERSGELPSSGTLNEEEWWKQATQSGALLIALGGVTCQFHREIAPYRRYEIWTRLLTWDRKWLYIVSHFVEAGTFNPSEYVLQPWRTDRKRRVDNLGAEDKQKLKRKIFASSIAKYVVKKGRLTIPPELVLERCNMLPPRPEGTPVLGGWTPTSSAVVSKVATPERASSPSPEPAGSETTAAESAEDSSILDPTQQVMEESLFPADPDGNGGDDWNWEKVQVQRRRGLQLAEAFDSLDGLKDVFDVAGEDVLGRYTDLALSF